MKLSVTNPKAIRKAKRAKRIARKNQERHHEHYRGISHN